MLTRTFNCWLLEPLCPQVQKARGSWGLHPQAWLLAQEHGSLAPLPRGRTNSEANILYFRAPHGIRLRPELLKLHTFFFPVPNLLPLLPSGLAWESFLKKPLAGNSTQSVLPTQADGILRDFRTGSHDGLEPPTASYHSSLLHGNRGL